MSATPSDKPKLMKRRTIRKAELLVICERQLMSGKIAAHDQAAFYAHDGMPSQTVPEIITWLKRNAFCEYSGEKIGDQPFDFDHKIPNAMLYEGDEIVWEILLRKWHKVKTKTDIKDISRARRLAGETGQYARRMRRGESLVKGRSTFQPTPEGHSSWGQSRGFQKKGERVDYARHDD